MNYKSQLIAAGCIAALAFAPSGLSAAGKKASASPTDSASPAATRPLPFHGMVSAVDQHAKTFTIAGKTASRAFKVTSKTAITKGANAATINDIVKNVEVSGAYWKAADGSLEAKMVKIGPMSSGEKKTKKSKAATSPAASSEASPKS